MPATAAPPLPHHATAGQLARLLGLTERVILGRTSDGRLPRTVEGHIDLRAVVEAGVAALAAKGQSDDNSDLEQQKTRLASEQADQVAMKNAVMRRELVPLVEINQAVMGMISTTQRHLARAAAKAFPTDHANQKRMADGIEAALIDLSAERAKPR